MRLRFLAQQVYVLSSCDVRERLLRFFIGRFGKKNRYHVDLSKKDVAEAIATTPETLSRVLARMEERGELQWERTEITVADDTWEDLVED